MSGEGQNTFISSGAAAQTVIGTFGGTLPTNLTYTVGTGNINYFVGKFASQSLTTIEDTLTLNFTVILSNISAAAGINFRFGLFNVGDATTGATGGADPNSFNTSSGYWAGYSPASSVNVGIRQRTGANNVLFATGIAPQFSLPDGQFVTNLNGTYSGSLTLELLTGGQVKITSQFAGLQSNTVTDTADAFRDFNAFSFYINGTSGSAALNFSDLSVTYTSSIPEPSIYALLMSGAFGLLAILRRLNKRKSQCVTS
ncbi:PEP-CTERM sorting domain-containing protein [Opitutaceae bacterium TAV4]|nr:PEP-CTERM sorting domain-containing protein [Opitutaceae bacterium TAV4]RRK00178.1 PEP-CTERM sorting domain-containing protein [Opitutaceae bacterium TAV3]